MVSAEEGKTQMRLELGVLRGRGAWSLSRRAGSVLWTVGSL